MKPAAGTASVVVERVGAEHRDPLAAFFLSEWGAAAGPVADAAPKADPSWVCVRDGAVIGYLGSIRTSFQLDGERVAGHWLKGFWVLPEYRSGPVGFMLLRTALRELGVVAVSLVALPARRLLMAAGVTERAQLFNRLLVLRPEALLRALDPQRVGLVRLPAPVLAMWSVVSRRPLLGVAGVGVRAVLGARRIGIHRTGTQYTLRTGWDVDDGALDGLWAELKDQVRTQAVRDSAALRERYAVGEYDLITVWDGTRLVAWSVLRHVKEATDERIAGLRVASLSDILFPTARVAAGHAAVGGAERHARALGADALLCSGSHDVLERVLRARAFLRLPGNLFVLARDHGGHVFAGSSTDLWATRGDGRSDETF